MASPLVRIDFLTISNIIGEPHSTTWVVVPAVDVLTIAPSKSYPGHADVILTGQVNPENGSPRVLVSPEDPFDLATRINRAMGLFVGEYFHAPAVAENSHAQPEAVDVEVAPV